MKKPKPDTPPYEAKAGQKFIRSFMDLGVNDMKYMAYAISIFALIAYFFAKAFLQIPNYWDGLSTILWTGLTGTLITWQARIRI
jgi:hypothetical protein